MPPLPKELTHKYVEVLKLSAYDAEILTSEKSFAEFFETIINITTNYKAAANWMLGPVKSWLNENALDIDALPVTANHIADIIKLIDENKLNFSIASQQLFPAICENAEKQRKKQQKN